MEYEGKEINHGRQFLIGFVLGMIIATSIIYVIFKDDLKSSDEAFEKGYKEGMIYMGDELIKQFEKKWDK